MGRPSLLILASIHRLSFSIFSAFTESIKCSSADCRCSYAEEEVKPYLRDFIFDAAQNKTRLFLSHVTSSTHHPWNVPKSFHKEQYMGRGGRSGVNHRPMNDYLNTVRYDDEWLGEILGLLDEAKIADSTLVVLVGDQ